MFTDHHLRKNPSRLLLGAWSAYINENDIHFDVEEFLERPGVVNPVAGSRNACASYNLYETYHSRNTYAVMRQAPWSTQRDYHRDDCDDGFGAHRAVQRLKEFTKRSIHIMR